MNMLGRGKALGCDFAFAQRMPRSYDPNVAIPEQRLRTHFRTDVPVDHAGFQVDGSIAQGPTVLVELVKEAQSNARRLFGDPSQQWRTKVFHEALTGAQREHSIELSEMERVGGAKGRFGVMDELTDRVTKLERPG